MRSFFKWVISLFKPLEKPNESLQITNDKEIFHLKLRIAELENLLIQFGKAIQKTNETILIIQESITNINKVSKKSLNLAQEHEDIFKKIIEDKLLVFGLTKNVQIVNQGGSKPHESD